MVRVLVLKVPAVGVLMMRVHMVRMHMAMVRVVMIDVLLDRNVMIGGGLEQWRGMILMLRVFGVERVSGRRRGWVLRLVPFVAR
mmetsp:Transcript_29616/g.47133  ORF Transcript_29616/g.47133 Transcript_29616/m.47133 type:complete len:84 (+) Transcript_29616:108-359(+)